MRKTTVGLRCGLLMALLVPLFVAPASAASRVAAPTAGACAGQSGVTVVVDLTDLGGNVEVSCAHGTPTTGRQALVDAGFRTTDDAAGMICAINLTPDPCPATFAGSYWSYWSAAPGAAWTAYAVGADSSHPAPGGFEGWRYNDGSKGPSLLPAALQVEKAATAPAAAENQPKTNQSPTWVTAAETGVVALLLGAALLVARRRRAADAGTGSTDDHRD
jgi:LPXTG-motif cell wall-anchored protein